MIDIYELKAEKVGEIDYDGPEIVETPEDLYNAMVAYGILDKTEEHIYLITFNESREISGIFEVARGSVRGVPLVYPEIFKRAFVMNCMDIAIVHNHFSKSPEPSDNDINGTRDLLKCCDLLDVYLMDHIITCRENGSYFSMREEGILDQK